MNDALVTPHLDQVKFQDQAFGALGALYESGTTAITGRFYAIYALEDTVFSVLTSGNWIGDSTASLPLPAGGTIFGNFSAFTLTSGKVLAYKR